MQDFQLEKHQKTFSGRAPRPDPLGELKRSPRPPSREKGEGKGEGKGRGKEGREWKGKGGQGEGGKERGGQGEGRVREGKGNEGKGYVRVLRCTFPRPFMSL